MKRIKDFLGIFLFFITLLLPMSQFAQNSFSLIVLGSGGGIDDSNLSAYLLSPSQADRYICLDAGTLMHGLKLASEKGHFDHLKTIDSSQELPAYVLHQHIDAYIISHPHLDHIMGMMIAGPFDNHKSILCSNKTANEMLNHIFESNIWGNFTSEGKNPVGKWDIIRLTENKWQSIPNNPMKVKPYTLCHSCPNEANAFLVESMGNYILYFGDTGADEIEGQGKLSYIFQDIAELVRQKKLKALLIEVSFSNQHHNQQLYGHLKPELLGNELEKLAKQVNPKDMNNALEGLKVFITHIKPNYETNHNSRDIIIKQVESINKFGAEFIYPKQAEKFEL